MKKIIFLCILTVTVGGFAFAQEQDPGFSNTLYTGFGTASVAIPDNQPAFNKSDEVIFEGFVDYFSANVTVGNLVIAGDIAWSLGYNGNFETAKFYEWNFNAVMNPIAGLDIGIGTNLDWTVGPAPTYGPSYTAYTIPSYAGLGIWNADGAVVNTFADKAMAIRYTFADIIQAGFGLNNDNGQGYGLGVKANILDLFHLGFAYNGTFKEGDSNFYVGSSLFIVDGFDIDIWFNHYSLVNTTIGGRVSFYKNNFFFAPEGSVTLWDANNRSLSAYAGLDMYMSITSKMLLGAYFSWGYGDEAGTRLNANPYFIWNITNAHSIAIGANLMPLWPESGDLDFYWNVPISWRVRF
ncbi:MAG: hypothetical protein R3Y36_02925 [Spirochaetales bacterium]